jgi:hypothetical protein
VLLLEDFDLVKLLRFRKGDANGVKLTTSFQKGDRLR